jgi:hypothetical protein
MGGLLSEFGDVRAGALRALGCAFAGLGIALLAAQLLFGLHELLAELAVCGIVVGGISFGIGKILGNNRLLIYREGVVQVKAGRTEAVVWQDIHKVYLQQEKRYYSGLNYDVRYHCSLKRKDGTWLVLDAIRITPSVAKAIRQGAATPVVYSEVAIAGRQ